MDEKTIIEIFGRLLDERDKRMDAMLSEMRSEMYTGFNSVRAEMNAGFSSVRERFAAVDERISTLDQKVGTLDQKVCALDEKIDSQTEDIRNFILENNSAIADIMTTGLESTEAKVKKLESNITVLRQG